MGQELLVGGELGVAAQDQSAAIGGGQVHVEHLDGGELVEDGARGQAGGKRAEPRPQGDVQAVGEERLNGPVVGLSASGLQNGQGVGVLTGLSNSFGIINLTNAGLPIAGVAHDPGR